MLYLPLKREAFGADIGTVVFTTKGPQKGLGEGGDDCGVC